MINTARIGNLLDQNVPVEYKIIQGTIITMIFCRIGTGKSTHAHAQWYNSLSVGNSLAAAATPAMLACIWKSAHTLTGIQWYSSIISFVQNFLSVGNSLAFAVACPVYGSAHIHAVLLYRVPARILTL